ncbi:MAG: heat-inducible transcription repressor HrcA [Firmicutes bacterium]|nr:heat-inducible transcription repressor HrcA [Bacillota bacterium]
MGIDGRKLKILQAIIHNYITNAEPVGSRTISKKYDLGVSPATIRNEMSDLEELGFLVQPHTSAGRVPSDRAYRLYVDSLVNKKRIKLVQKRQIKTSLVDGINELEELIQNSAKVLSKLTNYTSLAIAPQLIESRLKHIQLVPIDETKLLMVLVTNSGIVKNTVFNIEKEISNSQLNLISNFLTKKLKGHRIDELGIELKKNLTKEIFELRDVIKDVMPMINKSIDDLEEIDLYSDGVTNIFNFPEYNDITKAKSFLSFLENKENVIDMLLRNKNQDIEITIGKENCYEEIKNCSLITATYRFNGKTIGKVGVIGPTRMAYAKVIPVVKSIAVNLNDILEKHFEL